MQQLIKDHGITTIIASVVGVIVYLSATFTQDYSSDIETLKNQLQACAIDKAKMEERDDSLSSRILIVENTISNGVLPIAREQIASLKQAQERHYGQFLDYIDRHNAEFPPEWLVQMAQRNEKRIDELRDKSHTHEDKR